jgi:hypothetical protein
MRWINWNGGNDDEVRIKVSDCRSEATPTRLVSAWGGEAAGAPPQSREIAERGRRGAGRRQAVVRRIRVRDGVAKYMTGGCGVARSTSV